MSFGSNKSKSTSQSQSTAQQTLDPQVKAALLGNYDQFVKNFPDYQPYGGTDVADFTPQQLQSFGLVGDIANNQTGQAPLDQGIATTQGITGFSPMQVTAPTARASLIDPSTIPNVTAGQVGQMDLSPYLSPYMRNVVDTTSAAARNALGIENNQTNSDATKLGAWRGSAAATERGVNEAQTNIGLAQEIARLENQGFETALGTATGDVNRTLTAAQGNQATQLAEGQTNAGLGTQTALENAAHALAAGQSNQQAGIAGAGLRLQAGQNLASMGEQDLQDALARASAVNQSGNQQQAHQQALLDWAYQNNYLNPQQYAFAKQQLRNQTLGLAGNPVIGQSQSTSKGTSSSHGFNFGFGVGMNPSGTAITSVGGG